MPSRPSNRARELFASGCNCCQAVAVALCADADAGVSEETVMRLSACFGGGMRRKEVCGAVSGALMALGLKYGAAEAGDKAAKAAANERALAFMNEFERRHGSYLCRDLQSERCAGLVAAAVTQAEEADAEFDRNAGKVVKELE